MSESVLNFSGAPGFSTCSLELFSSECRKVIRFSSTTLQD